MAYTTINKSSDYFSNTLYTGNGSANHSITGVGFQPDFTWIKDRNNVRNHVLTDAVRGVTKNIFSNTTGTESTDTSTLTAFNSDGFTLGNGTKVNGNSINFASWNWKAGTGQGSSNTAGSINTTYTSVNTTAGFSISQYTGNASSGATIGHGLGSVPKMIMVKNLSIASNWLVYNYSMSANGDYALFLDSTSAKDNSQDYWGDTTPTSSVFSLGARQEANGSGNSMIAYCFADVQGYSKFGSYVGNGNADGPFIYTGFSPSFIMGKRTDSTGPWWMLDNKRDGYNVTNRYLLADDSRAEGTDAEYNTDFLSNGWKARYSNGNFNASGGSYIYMAFAEAPLVGTNNIPANAR